MTEKQEFDSNTKDLVDRFRARLNDDPTGPSDAVAAIGTLLDLIKRSKAGTIAGLQDEIKRATEALISAKTSIVSVSSGCELFVRFITLTSEMGEEEDFGKLKGLLIERGSTYLDTVASSRQKIADVASPFIRDGTTILIHSSSRVVFTLLKKATEKRRRLKIFITASDGSGKKMKSWLEGADIKCRVILDSAVGFIMEKVDLVIVGAEGVVESGGILNKIGTYQVAVMAKALNKPFYVVAESFKFVRLYPLKQADIRNAEKYESIESDENLHPYIDYTPPQYISLLFTDLGVLTPSAVSDELIKLYW